MRRPRLPRFDPYWFSTFSVGVLVLAGSFLPRMPERLEALYYFVPEGTARRVLFVIGLLLLYLSEQIARRKKNCKIPGEIHPC